MLHDQDDRFQLASFFVIRTPLLPALTRLSPQEAVEDPTIREALVRASPSLMSSVDGEKESRRDPWPSVARYLLRMARRPTPFSLMAGYSVGRVEGRVTDLQLGARAEYVRCVRATTRWLSSRVAHARCERWQRPRDLVFLPDLVRRTFTDPTTSEEHSVEVARSAAVDRALAAASMPASLEAVATAVAGETASGDDRARGFAEQLIEAGLLVRADAVPVMVPCELEPLAAVDPDAAARLRAVRERPLHDDISLELATLHARVGLSAADLIFDLHKPLARGSLGSDVVREALDVVRVLRRVAIPQEDRRLRAFARAFRRLWGSRAVPLLEALDPHRGVSFPARQDVVSASTDALLALRARLFERGCRAQDRQSRIEDADLAPLTGLPTPPSLSLTCHLSRDPLSLFDPHTTSPPGTQSFARATAGNQELLGYTRAFLREVDEVTEGECADLSYPLDAAAPFVQYPPLQRSEVTFTATTGVDEGRSIDPNDVTVEVDDVGAIVVRDRSTGRELRPRLTSALNPNRSDVSDAFRFLASLQSHHEGKWQFRWGPLSHASTLPRVVWRAHVLCPAAWRLATDEKEHLANARSRDERWDRVQRMRADRELPRYVRATGSRAVDSQELALDLDDPWSIEAWLSSALPDDVLLVECPPYDRSAVRGPEGAYAHELVLPLRISKRKQAQRADAPPLAPGSARPAEDGHSPFGAHALIEFRGDRQLLVALTAELTALLPMRGPGTPSAAVWSVAFRTGALATASIELLGPTGAPVLGDGLREELDGFFTPLLRARQLHSVEMRSAPPPVRFGNRATHETGLRIGSLGSLEALCLHESGTLTQDQSAEAVLAAVRVLRRFLLAAGLAPDEMAAIAGRAAEQGDAGRQSRSARHAGTLYRAHRAALDAIIGDAAPPQTLATAFDELREAMQGAGTTASYADAVRALLVEQAARVLPPWWGPDDLGEIALMVLRRVLDFERARGSSAPIARPQRGPSSD